MSQQKRSPFAVTCPDCEVEKEAEEANEILEFFRRHRGLTGHDLAWKRVELDVDVPSDADLKTLVGELESHFENGVPIGVIAAASSERGLSIAETLAEIYDLRMGGGLYEPRDDHLRAF